MFSLSWSNKLSQVLKKKNSVVFFSFVICFRLVIHFYSYIFICWLDLSPTSDFPTDVTIIWQKISAVIDTTFAAAKRKPEKKKSGLYGTQILYLCDTRCSSLTNWVNKPTGNRSLNWFVVNPWKDDDEVIHIWKSYIMRIAGWRIIWRSSQLDKDLTPNSLGTNDGQVSRWGGCWSFELAGANPYMH